jgi:hypothetical protein
MWGPDPPTPKALSHRYQILRKLAAEYDNSGGNHKSGGNRSPSTAGNGGLATPKTSPKTTFKRPSSDEEPPTPTPRRPKRLAAQKMKPEVESPGETEEEFPPMHMPYGNDDSTDDEYRPVAFMQTEHAEVSKGVGEVKGEATSVSAGQGIAEEVGPNGRVSNEIKALGKELQERTQSPVKHEVVG